MITENYIKMCEQAEEIQKEYIPIWSRVLVKPCWAVNINTWGVVTCAANEPRYCDVFMNGNQYGGIEIKDFIWLPTQEQLFEMLDVKNGKDFDLLIRKISYYEYRETNYFGCDVSYQKWCGIDNKYKYCDSINEMLLVMVYDLKYNKIWTGEKWVKAND